MNLHQSEVPWRLSPDLAGLESWGNEIRENDRGMLTTFFDCWEGVEPISNSSPAIQAWICDAWRGVFQVVRREHRGENRQSALFPG